MSFFYNLEMLPEDPIFGLVPLYTADTHPNKINLAIGSYKDENGNPYLLNTVKKAEEILIEKSLNKEYQAFEGDPIYRLETLKLIFGENSSAIKNDTLFCAQTIGASGALFLGASLLKKAKVNTIAISNPTWSNHASLMSQANLNIVEYPYYDAVNKCLCMDACYAFLKNLPPQTAVLFHACCHNPTGMDPTIDEWKMLAKVCKDNQLIPFFDCAYQGFYKNIDDDTACIRYFGELGLSILIAYSYSKNFGLYGERAGALCVLAPTKEISKIVESQVKSIIRSNYSSPPLHSARIVKTILTSPELKKEWQEELASMCQRIRKIRELLAQKLNDTHLGDFSFIQQQNGMFGFLGLKEQEVKLLRQDYGIYMPLSSRINIAGLNLSNIDYFVNSIKAILT